MTRLDAVRREVVEEAGPVGTKVRASVGAVTWPSNDRMPVTISVADAAVWLAGEVTPGDDLTAAPAGGSRRPTEELRWRRMRPHPGRNRRASSV